MTWFRVDDALHSHPKAMAAGLAPMGLWTIAGSWSNANLTDGFVPDYMLPRFAEGASEHAEKLVAVGLWRRAKGGYRFHDWSTYQESRETRLKKREAWRDKKAGQRAGQNDKSSKGSSRGRVSQGDTQGDSKGDSSGESRLSHSHSHSSSPNGEEVPRDDVMRICTHLADKIESNGSIRPDIGKTWLTAARLLIDKDRRDVASIIDVIDWCQADGFWRGNVMSMPTLREKFDRLRLASERPAAPNNRLVGADSRNGQIDWDDPALMEM